MYAMGFLLTTYSIHEHSKIAVERGCLARCAIEPPIPRLTDQESTGKSQTSIVMKRHEKNMRKHGAMQKEEPLI